MALDALYEITRIERFMAWRLVSSGEIRADRRAYGEARLSIGYLGKKLVRGGAHVQARPARGSSGAGNREQVSGGGGGQVLLS